MQETETLKPADQNIETVQEEENVKPDEIKDYVNAAKEVLGI